MRAYSTYRRVLAYRDNNSFSADRAYICRRHPYIRGTCVFVADAYISSNLRIPHTDYVFFGGYRCSGPHRGHTSSYPFCGDRYPNRHKGNNENDVCRVRTFVSPHSRHISLVGGYVRTFPYLHIPHNGYVASDAHKCSPLCIPRNGFYVSRVRRSSHPRIHDSVVSYGSVYIPHFPYRPYRRYVPFCGRISRHLHMRYRCKDTYCARTSCADTWVSLRTSLEMLIYWLIM